MGFLDSCQASERSLVNNMHDMLEITNKELDQYSKDVDDALETLVAFSDGLHVNAVTHNEAKLCQFYHDCLHQADGEFHSVLHRLDDPEAVSRTTTPFIQNRLQFFAESTLTRLAALDQAADLIRDSPIISLQQHRTDVEGVGNARQVQASKELDSLAQKLNKVN